MLGAIDGGGGAGPAPAGDVRLRDPERPRLVQRPLPPPAPGGIDGSDPVRRAVQPKVLPAPAPALAVVVPAAAAAAAIAPPPALAAPTPAPLRYPCLCDLDEEGYLPRTLAAIAADGRLAAAVPIGGRGAVAVLVVVARGRDGGRQRPRARRRRLSLRRHDVREFIDYDQLLLLLLLLLPLPPVEPPCLLAVVSFVVIVAMTVVFLAVT